MCILYQPDHSRLPSNGSTADLGEEQNGSMEGCWPAEVIDAGSACVCVATAVVICPLQLELFQPICRVILGALQFTLGVGAHLCMFVCLCVCI